MNTVAILGAEGHKLDARVDISDGAIVLHSRSGGGATTRNRDYKPALEAILERLWASGLKPDVFLDSRPVQHLPMNQRKIASASQLTGPVEDQFNLLVRKMNEGSRSNGAWRRIMLAVPAASAAQIADILSPKAPLATQPPIERLTAEAQRSVTAQDIHQAVDRLLAGGDAPNFGNSRDYDLLTETGARLAPKKVFGLALETALGIDAHPAHFSAGWNEPCFQLLQDAGYSIVRKSHQNSVDADKAKNEIAGLPPSPEELRWAEGDVRIVRHLRRERARNPRAAEAKRRAVRNANSGRLACEHCETDWYQIYPPEIAEGIFDIHHAIPLADLDEGRETELKDLLCLCANCHRAEHRRLALL